MSHLREDQQSEAREELEPFTLIIDETPMFGPSTDNPARSLIKDLIQDLAKHARQHPVTLH